MPAPRGPEARHPGKGIGLPTIILKRALTFADGAVLYRRGEPRQVADGDYLRLLATGDFADPPHEINVIPPRTFVERPRGP